MDERKQIAITDLVIWTDNPRHGLQSSNESLTEKDVINILVDVVGSDKMFNLAKDIFTSHGLMGNVIPTVVERDGKYSVYDGNRRLSAIKFLRNPDILDDLDLRKRVHLLVDNIKLDFLDVVDVFITTEENALELMDKTHGGEQNGIGVIPWDSYQRDISLSKRNKTPLYPYAYKIAKVLGIKRKKDFLIPYTDLNRLFASQFLRNIFEIKEISSIEKDKVVNAITELKLYKEYKGFNSFSREFNIIDAGDESDSEKPIRRFCDWYSERQKGKDKYQICLQAVKLFTDNIYSINLHDIKIKDTQGNFVDFDYDELFVEFTTPLGKMQKNLDMHFLGQWKIKVTYKGVETESCVNVISLAEPDIIFNDSAFCVTYGNSIDLTSTIIRALNSHSQDMRATVSIVPIDNAKIINNIFVAENPIGTYVLSFRFDNEGKQIAINKTIEVLDSRQIMVGKENKSKPFIFKSNLNITFSDDIAHLINEVNQLWSSEYHYILACSIRSILELSIDALRENKIIIFEKENLQNRLSAFKEYLIEQGLKIICNKNPESFTFLTEKNFVDSLDINSLMGILHLGAHKSASRVDMNTLLEKCQKQISVLIAYVETLLVKIGER